MKPSRNSGGAALWMASVAGQSQCAWKYLPGTHSASHIRQAVVILPGADFFFIGALRFYLFLLRPALFFLSPFFVTFPLLSGFEVFHLQILLLISQWVSYCKLITNFLWVLHLEG